MRTRYRVAIVIAHLAWMPLSLQAQTQTEQAIVDVISREGPQARAIRAAADVVTAAQAARLTFANPSISYSREAAGFTEFYQVEQPLPAFGLRAALQRAGVAAREAADAERDARLWQLRIDARSALARMRAASERLEAARALERNIEQLIGVLTIREREGDGSRFDRIRTEQELADARQLAASAETDRLAARGSLIAMLPPSIALPETVTPTSESINAPPVEALVQRAAGGRAELRALQSEARRLSLEADASRRAAGAAPTVSGGLKRADEGDGARAGAVIGLGVSVPLFNRGTRETARWDAERARIELERAAVEAAVRADVITGAAILSIRQQTTAAARTALAAADELVTMADVAYREGEAGILQLLDAYRTMGRAQERAVAARLELRLGEIALERAVGAALWP